MVDAFTRRSNEMQRYSMNSSVRKDLLVATLALVTPLLWSLSASAQTYKCSTPSGSFTYQDFPCGAERQQAKQDGSYGVGTYGTPAEVVQARKWCEDPKFRKELTDAGMPSKATLDQCGPLALAHWKKKFEANQSRARQYQADSKAKVEASRKAPDPQIGVTTTDDVQLGRVNWCNKSDYPNVDRNVTETGIGRSEQLICRSYGEFYKYLYFQNGVLKAKQS